MVMQGNRRGSPSVACTAWLVAGAITPLGGLIFTPLAVIGAALVLFGLVFAAASVHP
jgi:hypothetical protein